MSARPTMLYALPCEWFELVQRFHHLARALAPAFDLVVLAPRSHRRMWAEGRAGEWLVPWSEAPLGSGDGRILSVATVPFYRRHAGLTLRQWARFPEVASRAALTLRPAYDVLVIADPMLAPLADLVPHGRLVYECADEHAAFFTAPELSRRVVAADRALAARADLVVATSPALSARLGALNPRTVWLGNGVDLAGLAKVADEPAVFARPADLPVGPALVGFYGALGPWIDTALIAELARRQPGWDFVMIGPDHGAAAVDAPNVHMLGVRPYDALPAYLAHVPVWLAPFRPGPLTTAVDPLKVYEYLASGRQVVASPLPALAPMGDALWFAAEADTWETAIAAALHEGPRVGAGAPRHAAWWPPLAARDWDVLARRFCEHLAALG